MADAWAVHERIEALDACAWNGLLAQQPGATPFMQHAYLQALEDSGCVGEGTGWHPLHLSLHSGGTLTAACPAYLKLHSYGEYVFDWAWAQAYERNGLPYYPKLLVAVPFTPVPGARLLAVDAAARRALASALPQVARQVGAHSVHVLFAGPADLQAMGTRTWLTRRTVQFHWHNRQPQPYASFDEFLATLRRDKRKKIAQERRRVAESGVKVHALHGAAIGDAHWDHFYRCYRATYAAHHSTPYLNRDFFARVAQRLDTHWLMLLASIDGSPVAASLVAVDTHSKTAHGRYWGCTQAVPLLHFELCYYAPVQWCIDHGYQRFEGGAQGEHKLARGLLPHATESRHHLADSRFHEAVGRHLALEEGHIVQYVDELEARSPMRPASAS